MESSVVLIQRRGHRHLLAYYAVCRPHQSWASVLHCAVANTSPAVVVPVAGLGPASRMAAATPARSSRGTPCEGRSTLRLGVERGKDGGCTSAST